MFVTTLRPGEALRIGPDVRITAEDVRRASVRLGVDAPPDVAVYRGELTAAEREKFAAQRTPAGGSSDGNAQEDARRREAAAEAPVVPDAGAG